MPCSWPVSRATCGGHTEPPPLRRADAPGPARLVSSLADLAALLLVARLALRFFGLAAPSSPFGGLIGPILAVTNPVVAPFHAVLPDVRVLGGVLETVSLVAIVVVYLVAGLIGQVFLKTADAPRPARLR